MMATILLVEDNLMNLDMLSRRLEKRGYNVITANDGQTAIEIATSQQPDLILMDMNLPILDGWEATRRIKAADATSHIPICALTAHAVTGDREKALAAGCDDYESKPIKFPSLMQKVKTLLGELTE